MPPLIASDGLRARDSGAWGRDKLAFLDDYVPPALAATERKIDRFYLDLFAGPGINVERGSAEEFEGSPLRILRMHAPGRRDLHFTRALFINKHRGDHDALTARVDRRVEAGKSLLPRTHIQPLLGDANERVRETMAAVNPQAYALVFADIAGIVHWPFSSVRALTAGGHTSVDFYMLFPLEMAIQRFIAVQRREHTERYAAALTAFFGTEAWRPLADARLTDAQSPTLRHRLEELYLRQLRTLWTHAGAVKDVRIGGDRMLYRMLFASNHPVAKRLAEWARRQERSGQTSLF